MQSIAMGDEDRAEGPHEITTVTDFELRRSRLRMAGVVPVNALWEQAFATALAPSRKSGAAAFCSHTRAETVLAFTRSFRWLISAFHRP